MTAYNFRPPAIFSSITISQDVAERKAARKKVIERAQQLERESCKAFMRKKRALQATNGIDTIKRLIMNNEELLAQIGKVIDAKLDEKLEPITKRLDTVEKNMATKDDLKNMATKMDIHEIAEDMAGFFHKTWEKTDETNERVTTIEDHLDMPHAKEN